VIPEAGPPVPGEAGLARTGRLLMRPVEAVSALLLVVIVLLLLAGVASRYVFSMPVIWIDEVVSISFILTPLFNAARGSILIAALYHFQMNNPIWPDAQPYDSLVFAAIAVLVVIINRKALFTRGAGVTGVLMPGDDEAAYAGSSSTVPAGDSTLYDNADPDVVVAPSL